MSFGLFAIVNDAATGFEPYKIDPATGTATLLKDINPGPANGAGNYETNAIEYQGFVYFGASSSGANAELWRTDGTSAGTRLVASFPNSLQGAGVLGHAAVFENQLYFTVPVFLSGVSQWDYELWVTDGSTEGTHIFYSGVPDHFSAQTDLIVMGDAMYFGATHLGALDITTNGRLLKAQGASVTTVADVPELLDRIMALDNKLYIATERRGLAQLRVTDGNTTPLLLGVFGDVRLPVPIDFLGGVNGRLFFVPPEYRPADRNRHPWTSDGTRLGTTRLDDVLEVKYDFQFISFGSSAVFSGARTARITSCGERTEHHPEPFS